MIIVRPAMLYYAFIAIPLCLGIIALYRVRSKVLSHMYDSFYMKRLNLIRKTVVSIILVTFGVVSISFSLSRPMISNSRTINDQSDTFGASIRANYIILDVSASMYASDKNKKTRMANAVLFLRKYINAHPGDLYTLIVYTDTPALVVPMTNDVFFIYSVLNRFADVTQGYGTTDMRTVMADITNNERLFFSKNYASSASTIIFVSDGESHTKISRADFQMLTYEGYTLMFVSVGDGANKSTVPGFKKTFSHAQPLLLHQLAQHTGGTYIDASHHIRQGNEITKKTVIKKNFRKFESWGYVIAFICMCILLSIIKL